MTTSKLEGSPLYSIISFLVVWTDYIVRTYIRIKAAFDAVVYVAQSPITPRPHQRKPSVSCDSPKLHRASSPTAPHVNSTCSTFKSTSTTTPIRRLPDEVMQVMFLNGSNSSDLVQYTLVCQRWHRLVTPLLWKAPILPPSLPGPVGANYTPSQPHDPTTPPSRSRHQHHRRSSSTLSRNGHLSLPPSPLPSAIRWFRIPKYGRSVQTLRLGSIAEQVTDDLLLFITQHCPHLTVLDLSHCHHITSSGYQHLARSRCTSSLIQLNLSYGTQLTDSSLVSLSMRCDSLEIIHLAGCRQITRMGIRSLAAASRQSLQYINMKDCIKVSGHILQDLAILCGPRLVGVDATRICSVLHSDIMALVQHCPRLEQLYIGQNKSRLLCQLQQRIRDEQQDDNTTWELPFSSPTPTPIPAPANNTSERRRGRRTSSQMIRPPRPLSPTSSISSASSISSSSSLSSSPISAPPHPFSTSLSASLLQQRQLSRSKSSSQYTKPNALDSLLDMLQHYNVDPTDQQQQQQHQHQQQRVHRSRHLSQPGWQSNSSNRSISSILNGMNSPTVNGMYPLETDQVSQATVEMMMMHLKHLKAIDLSNWNCLTDQLVWKLRHGNTLQYIGLDGCLAPSARCD
ncbi:hypothetical protein [Absidia glauca]|uniref:Uncharacterized protein n=1 Tax=Absidia glauca TaxID=4829 RepID=A0A168NTI3_ABSGL|nr:hypothetical protein [Absidia glauca]